MIVLPQLREVVEDPRAQLSQKQPRRHLPRSQQQKEVADVVVPQRRPRKMQPTLLKKLPILRKLSLVRCTLIASFIIS
jgi:hypothetical protein